MKQFNVGGIKLPVNENPRQEFVPQTQPFIETKDKNGLLETLALGIEQDLPILLIGDTGAGKTSAVRYLANKTNNAFRRLNLNGQTTTDEFVGKTLINETGTYWTDGILIDAMRHGDWLLLDEINSALPEVLFVLQSLLDDDRYVVLSDKPDHEVVRPHENFRIFASMNPSDNYVGTKELNKALMSRFPIVAEVEYPSEEKEIEIIRTRYPKLDEYEAIKLVQFANELRASYKAQELDFILSPRDILNWIKLNEFYKDWNKSAQYAILGKCNQDDKENISGLLKIHFKTEAANYEDIKEGDEIFVYKDVDVHNTEVKIMAKSTMKVLGKTKTKEYGETIDLQVITVPKKVLPKGSANFEYASKGNEWSVRKVDIDGKFQFRRKGIK